MDSGARPAANTGDISTVTTGDKAGLLEHDGASTNGAGSPVGEGAPLQKHDVQRRPHDEPQFSCIKKGEGLKVLIISSIAFGVVITAALILQIHFGPPQVPPHGAVASDVAECSKVGVSMLKKGGSSVDAAIATLLCNGVINGQSSGIGGGHFMLIHDHKKMETKVIDARETAPAASAPDMYKNDPADKRMGAKSIAVPGEIRGFEKAHQLYGKLAWSDLFQPAIQIARRGFPVGKALAHDLKYHVSVKELEYTKLLADLYAPGGTMVVEGKTMRRETLALTLEKIANNGANEFYTGSVADEIVAAIDAKGGILTKADLEGYKPVLRPAIQTTYKDQTILAPPLPSGGATLLMMLNVMDKFNLSKSDYGTGKYYQQLVENFKYSFAEYYTLGDPDFNSTLDKRTDAVISKDYASAIMKKINPSKTYKDESHYSAMGVSGGKQTVDTSGKTKNHGTSHVSVIDADELLVSVTSSVNLWFGSRVMTSGGVILNDHMNDFSSPQETGGGNPYNYPEPGKRPLSAMAPSVVYNSVYKCGPRMAFGATNGTRILTSMVEVFLNLHLAGMGLQTAVDAPRIHDQVNPMGSWYESKFPADVLASLRALGHTLSEDNSGLSAVQTAMKVNESISAYSDPRKWGKADLF